MVFGAVGMKKLWASKSAFTLIETLLAITIFAAVALPLLTIFLQSAKVDRAARDVMNANYIAQDYIEKLDANTYKDVLNVPKMQEVNGYYLSAAITPYGNTEKLFFTSPCVYVQMVMLSDMTILIIAPDGKWQQLASVPGSVSISVSSGKYTISYSGGTITGTAKYNNCAVVVNAMKNAAEKPLTVSLGSTCKALVYCTTALSSKITVTGTSQYVKDINKGTTSPIFISVSVYQKSTDTKPLAVSEAYINIRNEK